MEISALCPHCGVSLSIELTENEPEKTCPSCAKNVIPFLCVETREGKSLSQCPICGARHTYRQKDFNRALGVGLILLGIGFSYLTYGISLVAVTLIDFFLFRRVTEVGCCYQCHAQFRKSPMVAQMEPFELTLHDYYRNLKQKREL